jgi:hypothetical protein
MVTIRETSGKHAIGSHAWPGFNPSNIVNNHNSILECNALTMNSATALMASHNILNNHSSILECKRRAPYTN